MGGWDRLYAFVNPPPKFLKQEVAPFADWLVWHLLISPRLEIYEARAKPLGDDAYQVRVVVQNTGWLPTYVTKKALEKKVVRGAICEVGLPEGATLETGKLREELGQLEGRAYKPVFSDDEDFTEDRAKVEWVIRAPQGGTVDVTARHERAGTVTAQVELT